MRQVLVDALGSLRRAEARAVSFRVGVRVNAALYLLALLALAVVTLEVRRGHPESEARQVRSLPRPPDSLTAPPAPAPAAAESPVPLPPSDPEPVPAEASSGAAPVAESAPVRSPVTAPDPAPAATTVASPAPPPALPAVTVQPPQPQWQPPTTGGTPGTGFTSPFGSPIPQGWTVAGPVQPATPEPLVIPPLQFQPLQPVPAWRAS